MNGLVLVERFEDKGVGINLPRLSSGVTYYAAPSQSVGTPSRGVRSLKAWGLPYRIDKLRAGGECVWGRRSGEALYELRDPRFWNECKENFLKSQII